MVINGTALTKAAPIRGMLDRKVQQHGVSHGLAEVGYDIRIKQTVRFLPYSLVPKRPLVFVYEDEENHSEGLGRFALASSVEEFDMPAHLVGIVHDKSTWARRGLSVFNTVIEPGWKGFLTLELVHHGQNELIIPAGSGIAQVIFHETARSAAYEGKYQHQADCPVPAIDS